MNGLKDFGVSTEQMSKALYEYSKNLPPLSEEDIINIYMNPSLSIFSKIILIRKIRKELSENERKQSCYT